MLCYKFNPTEKKGLAGLFDLSHIFWNTYISHIENKYSTVHMEPVLKDALSHLGHIASNTPDTNTGHKPQSF